MSVVVKQQPYNYSFSKNQLLWRFYTTAPLAPGCFIQIKLQAYVINGSAAPLEFIERIKPSTDGFANFYLQDIIDSMLEYKYPGSAVINIGENIKLFKLSYREVTNDLPSPAYITLATDYYIIKGGIETSKADYNNYFVNYLDVVKPFATWLPADSFAGIDDDFYISILFSNNFTTPDTDGRTLRITAEWSNASTDVIDIAFTPAIGLYLLYHIKAGATALGINALAAGRQLYRYKMQVINTLTPATTYSAVYTFYIDYRMFYKNRLFKYYNSLGGFDYVRVLGDTEESYNRNFTEAENLQGFIPVGSTADTLSVQPGITRFNSFKSDVGYRHTLKQAIHLQDLLMSFWIWEVINGKNVRVLLQNKNNKLVQNSDQKFNFPIEWRYGFTEQVYTPADADFGVAAGPVCPLPTGLTAVYDTDHWQFSCTAASAAIAYVFEYKLASEPLYTVVTDITNSINAGLLIDGDYVWRVKLICDVGNESGYATGTPFTV